MKKCHPPVLLHPLQMTAADASSFSYSDSLLRVELTEIYWKQWVERKSEQNEDLSIFSFNFQTVVLLLPRDQPSEKSRPSRGECSVQSRAFSAGQFTQCTTRTSRTILDHSLSWARAQIFGHFIFIMKVRSLESKRNRAGKRGVREWIFLRFFSPLKDP